MLTSAVLLTNLPFISVNIQCLLTSTYMRLIYVFHWNQTDLLFIQRLTHFMPMSLLQHYSPHKQRSAHCKSMGITAFFTFIKVFHCCKHNERNCNFVMAEWNTYLIYHDVVKCLNNNVYNAYVKSHLLQFSAFYSSQEPPYIQSRFLFKIQKLLATQYGLQFMEMNKERG